LGAVLRIGSNKIIVSGEYCLLELVKARDRTLSGAGCEYMDTIVMRGVRNMMVELHHSA
jgi:hypothetical protein